MPGDIDWPKDSRNVAFKSSAMDQPETKSGAGGSHSRALTDSLGAGPNVMTLRQDNAVTRSVSRRSLVQAGLKTRLAPLRQCRLPVGRGPSSNM